MFFQLLSETHERFLRLPYLHWTRYDNITGTMRSHNNIYHGEQD